MTKRLFRSAATLLPGQLITTIQQHCGGGGCWLYIPKQRAHARTRRQTLIRALHTQGYSTPSIARKAACSERYVRKVIATERKALATGETDANA